MIAAAAVRVALGVIGLGSPAPALSQVLGTAVDGHAAVAWHATADPTAPSLSLMALSRRDLPRPRTERGDANTTTTLPAGLLIDETRSQRRTGKTPWSSTPQTGRFLAAKAGSRAADDAFDSLDKTRELREDLTRSFARPERRRPFDQGGFERA